MRTLYRVAQHTAEISHCPIRFVSEPNDILEPTFFPSVEWGWEKRRHRERENVYLDFPKKGKWLLNIWLNFPFFWRTVVCMHSHLHMTISRSTSDKKFSWATKGVLQHSQQLNNCNLHIMWFSKFCMDNINLLWFPRWLVNHKWVDSPFLP